MKKFLYLPFIVCLSISCTDHDNPTHLSNTCSVDNPVEDLPWLKQKISEMETSKNALLEFSYIQMGTYKNETIFIANSCCPYCYIVPVIYNCNGDVMDNVDSGKVENVKTIWKPKNFACV